MRKTISTILCIALMLSCMVTTLVTPAKADTPTYTVTFDSKGGQIIVSTRVLQNEVAVKPINPTRVGYTFDNWYTDESYETVYNWSTPVTEDITLYAKWSPKTYNVYIYTDNGASFISQKVDYGNKITSIDNPELENCTLAKWKMKKGLSSIWNDVDDVYGVHSINDVIITDTIVFKPVWSPNAGYKLVSFDTGAYSDTPHSIAVAEGSLITQPEWPSKDGYIFRGWYTTSDYATKFDFDKPITDNVIIYGNWEQRD